MLGHLDAGLLQRCRICAHVNDVIGAYPGEEAIQSRGLLLQGHFARHYVEWRALLLSGRRLFAWLARRLQFFAHARNSLVDKRQHHVAIETVLQLIRRVARREDLLDLVVHFLLVSARRKPDLHLDVPEQIGASDQVRLGRLHRLVRVILSRRGEGGRLRLFLVGSGVKKRHTLVQLLSRADAARRLAAHLVGIVVMLL